MFKERVAFKAPLVWGAAFFVIAFCAFVSAPQAHAATVGDVVISYQILDAGTTRKGISSGVVTLNTVGERKQSYYNFFTPDFDYSSYQIHATYYEDGFVFFPLQEGQSGIYRMLSSGDRVPEKGSSSFYRYNTKVVKGADYIIFDDETDSLIKIHVNDFTDSVPWGTAPRIPLQASRSAMFPRAVDFYWYGVEGAQSYEVEFGCGSCVSGGFETPRYFTTSKPVYSFNHTLVTTDGEYRFAVRARNSSGSYGPWSEYYNLSFIVNEDNDGTVSVATSESSPDKNGKVKLTFTVSVSGVKKTKTVAVYVDNKYAKNCSGLPCVYTTDSVYKKGDVVSYAARTTHEEDYEYSFSGEKQLIVTGGDGTSNISNVQRSAPEITSPGSNKVLTNFPRVATLKWRALEGVSKYEVEIACDTCGTSVRFGEPQIYSTTETSYVTNPLAGDNEFRFRVRGLYGSPSESGPWSEYRYFRYKTSEASVDTTKNTTKVTLDQVKQFGALKEKNKIKPRKYPQINVNYTKVAAGDDGQGGFSTDDYYKVTVTSADGSPIKTIEIFGTDFVKKTTKCKNKTECEGNIYKPLFDKTEDYGLVAVRAYDRVGYPTVVTVELTPGGSACKNDIMHLKGFIIGSENLYFVCQGGVIADDSQKNGAKITAEISTESAVQGPRGVTLELQGFSKESQGLKPGESTYLLTSDERYRLKITLIGVAGSLKDPRAILIIRTDDYSPIPDFKTMKSDEKASFRLFTGFNDADLTRFVNIGTLFEALKLYNEIHGTYPQTTKPLVLGVKGALCLNADGFGPAGCNNPYLKTVPSSGNKYPFVYESKDGTTFSITFRFDKGSKKQLLPGAEAETVSTPEGMYDKKKGPPTLEELLKKTGELLKDLDSSFLGL